MVKKVAPIAGPRPSCVRHRDSCRPSESVACILSSFSGTRTHIPICRLLLHPHGLKSDSIEPRGLHVQGVDEAVDACVWLRIRLGEGSKWKKDLRGDGEALSSREDRGHGRRERIVACE